MPRRSPSPDSYKRYRDSDDRDKYRSRRDDAAGYRRNADRESRDLYRDRRGYSERDTRRSFHDGNEFDDNDRRRRDDGGDGNRRKNGYDGHDDGRRRRDEGNRYANRLNEGDDKSGLRRVEHHDRGDRDRLRDDRDHRERGDERRGSSRRSASPRRSRPHSRSRSRSHSPSASSPPDDKTKPNFAPSGLLAAATNTVKNSDGTSTLLKYNEPPEARKPLVGWRLYVFKGDEQVGAQPPSFFFTTTVLTSNTQSVQSRIVLGVP
jgi:smad nuclear-interacting protein 1